MGNLLQKWNCGPSLPISRGDNFFYEVQEQKTEVKDHCSFLDCYGDIRVALFVCVMSVYLENDNSAELTNKVFCSLL